MDETDRRIIWIVDEQEPELRTYEALFKKALPKNSDIDVVGVKALPHKEDYLTILNDPRTACIVIDQRLKETGEVDHTGIELTTFLRSINDKLPIYILTNFAHERDEFAYGEWSVEDVISKGEVSEPERLRVIIARILRHIDVNQSILNAREERFRFLLKKSLHERLDEDEWKELEDLRFYRTSAILAKELPILQKLEEELKPYEDIVENLKQESDDREQ